ncbi:hypothetical protein [Pseudomonas sp. MWU12-2323]|uniref:hypothetical protein n=1 Tax=Pseudomonas sp. MWU12-2323 TaxID=2651296 RepID=UPI00211519CF|nr:hypothetical protein [Pseudomonas sp. MWU12-2323]
MAMITGFAIDEAAEMELADGGLFGDSLFGRQVIEAARELLKQSEQQAADPLPLDEFYERQEDMGQGRLRLILDGDSDVCVAIISDEGEIAGVEFCVPFSGGGRSPKVREALIGLCHAIRDENISHPISRLSRNYAPMDKHTSVPNVDGLYWYFDSKESEPRPVMINQSRWGDKFKSFNGAEQSWLRDGEYLLGPLSAPKAEGADTVSLKRSFGVAAISEDDTEWSILPSTVCFDADVATSLAQNLAISADEETRYTVVRIEAGGVKPVGDIHRGVLEL